MSPSLPSAETITRVELDNGIVVLAYENFSSPAVVVGGYLWAGSLSETPEQAGLASFTAGMLMRGTETRTFGEINHSLESNGAQLGFRAGTHTVGFGGKALAEDLDLLLDTLADSLQHPTFPSEEAETLQGQILTALKRRAHDTRSMARLTFDALLYPDHPYGRSVLGYSETVSSLARDQIETYYRDHYCPEGMIVTVVGAVPAPVIVKKVRQAIGGWQPAQATANRTIPANVQLEALRRESVILAGKTQSDIILGWPGLARPDPDYWPARLANTILGVFGMMGRLGDNVREEQGLAYYVYSQLQAGLGAGPWLTIAGVNPGNVEQATDGILHEIRRLRDESVPADELADSQSFLTGSMPLRLETNEGIANAMLDMERNSLGFDYLVRYPELIQAVTVGDVQRVARKYLHDEAYALAIAGPGLPDN
jgi:zinc protease